MTCFSLALLIRKEFQRKRWELFSDEMKLISLMCHIGTFGL